MLAAFLEDIRDGDLIAPKRMANRLRLPLSRLSKLAHLNRNTMTSRPDSPAVQEKLGQIARIFAQAADISGDEGRALIWFKYQPMAGWGKTAEELVELGMADAVLEDLGRMEAGVYS
jgi:uncharacterized protein (DUF2384 family)